MSTLLNIEHYTLVIRDHAENLRRWANSAGLDAAVVTCPEWTVRDLIAHQGMVHRWAAANLRGETGHDTSTSHADGLASTDLIAWHTAGSDELVATIDATPDDVDAMVFLKNAPPPRQFWARREAHETLVHSVDALSATLGRLPRADEVDVPAEVATDGIDELLMGFMPQSASSLRSADPFVITVAPTDTGDNWTVRVSEDKPHTERGSDDGADATFAGSAAELYLGLWNRSDEITVTGRSDALDLWRSSSCIRWA